tara:strand:+ start:68 stop:319 length:252 start_codon:yes stop_codon:yes gene_type:complete
MAVDWSAKAKLTKLRFASDMPQATPRIVSCRNCGKDARAAGTLYCETHAATKSTTELLDAGEYHGNWRVGRNRLGNPVWERAI